VETEAGIVQQLVEAYLAARIADSLVPINRDADEPKVMVVTPHHQQRVAIQRRLSSYAIPIDTVEKMQGQECDLIIACFSCTNNKRGNEFLRDFRRWNVALSRARYVI
jgi:superfamily I DNA and/or RNA helicase